MAGSVTSPTTSEAMGTSEAQSTHQPQSVQWSFNSPSTSLIYNVPLKPMNTTTAEIEVRKCLFLSAITENTASNK